MTSYESWLSFEHLLPYVDKFCFGAAKKMAKNHHFKSLNPIKKKLLCPSVCLLSLPSLAKYCCIGLASQWGKHLGEACSDPATTPPCVAKEGLQGSCFSPSAGHSYETPCCHEPCLMKGSYLIELCSDVQWISLGDLPQQHGLGRESGRASFSSIFKIRTAWAGHLSLDFQ